MNKCQFLDNKYTKMYWKLLSDKRNRNKFPGSHKHHIVPTSLGGENNIENTIYLTPREHYICHLLLTKMTVGKDKSKMVYAFFRFQPKNTNVTSSRTYDKFVQNMKKTLCGEGNVFYGRKHSEETKEKIRNNHWTKNKWYVDIWIEKYGEEEAKKRYDSMILKKSQSFIGNKNPNFGKPRSEELKKLQSEKIKGMKFGPWVWINNGTKCKRIRPNELDSYLSQNWIRGMCKKAKILK